MFVAGCADHEDNAPNALIGSEDGPKSVFSNDGQQEDSDEQKREHQQQQRKPAADMSSELVDAAANMDRRADDDNGEVAAARLEKQDHAAAVTIQKVRRAQLARRQVDELRSQKKETLREQEVAIVPIQAAYRARKARQEFSNRKRARQERNAAVVKLQAAGRKTLAQRVYRDKQNAAVMIQKNWRGMAARPVIESRQKIKRRLTAARQDLKDRVWDWRDGRVGADVTQFNVKEFVDSFDADEIVKLFLNKKHYNVQDIPDDCDDVIPTNVYVRTMNALIELDPFKAYQVVHHQKMSHARVKHADPQGGVWISSILATQNFFAQFCNEVQPPYKKESSTRFSLKFQLVKVLSRIATLQS